jgi:GT2 family glycosyltransferase
MLPVVSIGLLTYNYGRYIQKAIDSVLAQTFTGWELLISDDCSTDDTADIVRPYLADPRVRYVRHPTNLRQGGNWAYAIEHGTADRIATLHADDWWLPDALATAMAAFDTEPAADLVCGSFVRVASDGAAMNNGSVANAMHGPATSPGGAAAYRAEATSFTCLPSAALFSRAAATRVGVPRIDLDMLVDFEFFLRIVAVARRVVRLRQPIAMYRCHTGSTTAATARDGRLVAELRRLPAIVATDPNATPDMVAAVRRRVARELYSTGLTQAIGGDSRGIGILLEAWHHNPLLLASPAYLLDLLLTSVGPAARPVLERLHPARVARPN